MFMLSGLSFCRSCQAGRLKVVVILAIMGFPAATLMLAKLLDSDVLGWLFGLTLMCYMVLVPVASVGWIGWRLFRRAVSRPDAASATREIELPRLVVEITRGAVHASDDAPDRQVAVHPRSTMRALIEHATSDSYLPGISGGRATWIVESTGGTAGEVWSAIAICAQQWVAPALLTPGGQAVADHFGSTAPKLNFRYRCQDEPSQVLADCRNASAVTRVPSVDRAVIA